MLDIDIKLKDALDSLTEFQKLQLSFASSLAINTVARMGQKAVQESLRSNFTIAPNRLRFLQRTIRFGREDRATKDKLWARVGINEGESGDSEKDRSYILGRHESGGTRTADNPLHPFFLPTKALRQGAYDVAPRNMYPTSLRIFERRTASGVLPIRSRQTKRGGVQIIGKRRTFVIDARATHDPRSWGIYQRFGPGPHDIRMIWAYRTKITLRPRLHLYETVQATVDANIEDVFYSALERALKTAR